MLNKKFMFNNEMILRINENKYVIETLEDIDAVKSDLYKNGVSEIDVWNVSGAYARSEHPRLQTMNTLSEVKVATLTRGTVIRSMSRLLTSYIRQEVEELSVKELIEIVKIREGVEVDE